MSTILSEDQLVSGMQEIYRSRALAQERFSSMVQDRDRLRLDPRTALPLALYDLSGADLSAVGGGLTPEIQRAWKEIEKQMLAIVKRTGMITRIWSADPVSDDIVTLSMSWNDIVKAWRSEKASILARPILYVGDSDKWLTWVASPEATQYRAPYSLHLVTLITSGTKIRQMAQRYDLGASASTSWIIADPFEIDCTNPHADDVARKIRDLAQDGARLSGMLLLRLSDRTSPILSESERWVAYDWSRERHDVRVYTSLHVDEEGNQVVDTMDSGAVEQLLQRIFQGIEDTTVAQLEPIFPITPALLRHDSEPSGPLAALALDCIVNRDLEAALAVLTRGAVPTSSGPNDFDKVRLAQRLELGRMYQLHKEVAQMVVDGKVPAAA